MEEPGVRFVVGRWNLVLESAHVCVSAFLPLSSRCCRLHALFLPRGKLYMRSQREIND